MIARTWTRIAAALAALGLFVAAGQAQACSMSPEFVRPTNFELVQLADAIVIATALDQTRKEDNSQVAFRIEGTVKGSAPATLSMTVARLGQPEPSNLDDISSAHPEAYAGPCNRMTFAKGGKYLLFLDRGGDGVLGVAGHAFSRVSEDYRGEDNSWMRVVRRYVALQAKLGSMEQIAALEQMLRTGRDDKGAKLAANELADIRDHLSSLSPYKPTAYLLAAYETLERGGVPAHGVRSGEADREQSAADALTRAMFPDLEPKAVAPREEAKLRVLTALVNGTHPDPRPLFDRLLAEKPEEPRTLGLALRYLAKNGAYDRAFEWIETRLMPLLPRLDPRSAQQLIRDARFAADGDVYADKEAWRSNPHAAKAWPELSLALHLYGKMAFGEGSGGDELREIPHGDPRARPNLTLALAEDYADGTAEWAKRELLDKDKRLAWEALEDEQRAEAEDPALLPLRMLLVGWTKENGDFLAQIFCQSAPRRALLIQQLGEVGDGLYGPLRARIAASPLDADQDEGDLLEQSIAISAGRELKEEQDMFSDSLDLLRKLLRKEKIDAEPIVCKAA